MNDDNLRIVFYPLSDLSVSLYYYDLVKLYVNEETSKFNNVLDVIELYEVYKYINAGIFKNSCDEDLNKKCINLEENAYSKINIFFKTNLHNLVFEYEQIEISKYRESFWELIEKMKIYEELDIIIFERLLNLSEIRIILEFPKLVNIFNSILKKKILSDEKSAELLLENYIIKEELLIKNELTFPKFSNEEINEILKKYIDSENPNPIYLDGIVFLKSTICKIDPMIRNLARKKSQYIIDNKFSSDNTKNILTESIEIIVAGYSKKKEILRDKSDVNKIILKYDKKSLFTKLDSFSILTNFIDFFEFADFEQKRLNLINIQANSSLIEQLINPRYKDSFNPNLYFSKLLNINIHQLFIYRNILTSDFEISLETIVKSYFEEFLSTEFNIKGFRIISDSFNLNYFDKCKNLCTEFDSIIKQFTLLVNYGEINLDMLDLISLEHFDSIPSLLKEKYYYEKGETCKNINFLLFSDQCMLKYIQRIEERGTHYKNFYDMVCNEDIFFTDYKEPELSQLSYLLENNFIYIDEFEKIQNTDFANILYDIFLHGVINKINCENNLKKEILKLEKLGYLFHKDTLLARCEADTFDYILNNKKYRDNLAIRNKYIHGDMTKYDNNNEVHMYNYHLLFVLLISLIIKINDEIENK